MNIMNINFTFTYDKRITDKEKENDSEAAVYIQCNNKNAIRDGGNTALYPALLLTLLTWFTLFTLVYTVDKFYTIQTVLHCLNSSMYAYIYC